MLTYLATQGGNEPEAEEIKMITGVFQMLAGQSEWQLMKEKRDLALLRPRLKEKVADDHIVDSIVENLGNNIFKAPC